MDVGEVRLYNGKPVYITGGEYESNGRVSNFWDFRYINKWGFLGSSGGDYDNCNEKGKRKFGKILKFKLRIMIKR